MFQYIVFILKKGISCEIESLCSLKKTRISVTVQWMKVVRLGYQNVCACLKVTKQMFFPINRHGGFDGWLY